MRGKELKQKKQKQNKKIQKQKSAPIRPSGTFPRRREKESSLRRIKKAAL